MICVLDHHKNNKKLFSDESWKIINLFSVVKPGKPKRPHFVCNQKLKSSFKKRLSESDQTSVTTPIKTLTQSPTLDQTPAQSPTSTKTSAQSPTSVTTPIKTSTQSPTSAKTQSQKPRTRLSVNKEGIQVKLNFFNTRGSI